MVCTYVDFLIPTAIGLHYKYKDRYISYGIVLFFCWVKTEKYSSGTNLFLENMPSIYQAPNFLVNALCNYVYEKKVEQSFSPMKLTLML